MLKQYFALIVVVALVSFTARAEDPFGGLFGDPVIARGKGVEIKRSQLEDAYIAYKANLAGRGTAVPEAERVMREALLLDRLIVTQLLLQRAVEADRTIARTNTDKVIGDTLKELNSAESFRRRLKALGLSPERYTNQVIEQTVAQAVVDRELRSKIVISDERVRNFFETGTDVVVTVAQAELERMAKDPKAKADDLADAKKQIEQAKKANLARLEQPERIRVSHVMLATRERNTEEPLTDDQKKIKRTQIDKIRIAAMAGEDFQKLITEFSEDRNLNETKGEYVLTREQMFLPEFKVAAFNLQPGQISEVVTTPFGFHIIKCLDHFPAKKVDFNDKTKNDIREALTDQELQREMVNYFRRLKSDAGVEIVEAKYRIEAPKDVNPLRP